MYASTGDERFKARADLMVAELARVQAAMPSAAFHPGYLSAFPEELFDRVEKRVPVWAPYYTLHKILAGLLDANQLCDNRQALDVPATRSSAGCSSAWIGSRTSSSRRCSRPSSAA